MPSINSLYSIENQTASTIDDTMQKLFSDAEAQWKRRAANKGKEFSMSSFIDDALNKESALSSTELQVLTMHYGLDSDTDNTNIAERVNAVRRQTELEEKELRDAFNQVQNNPDIEKEFLYSGSERKIRQAGREEEIYRKALDKNQQQIANEQGLKDLNAQGKEAWKNRRKDFLGNLGDDDPLFKLSGQEELQKVYNSVHNKKFKDEYIAEQLQKGRLQKQYDGFDFSKGMDSLTDAQKAKISSDYDAMVDSRFERYMKPEYVDGKVSTPVPKSRRKVDVDTQLVGQGPAKLDWEHGELSRRLAANSELAHNAYSNDSLFAVDKTKPIKTGGNYDKSLNAYKSYLSKNIDNAKEDIMGLDDFLLKKEALTKSQIDMAKKDLASAGHVLEGAVSDGIKASSKLKGLKVAGGIAGGLVALWALSEVYDE